MGYTTSFSGHFDLNKPLTKAHQDYLKEFCNTRRMARDINHAGLADDVIRLAAELPLGDQGGYYVGATGFQGQDNDASVINYNTVPVGQPGLWCQWMPGEDGKTIEWDGGEKFYCYVEWLEYIIEHFLQPWGYVLNGDVYWEGEDGASDTGRISVMDNVVNVSKARISYGKDDYDTLKAERDVLSANLATLQTLWAGSAKVGRWLVNGEESEPDAEGATWEPYTTGEQVTWLLDAVVPMLEQMLFKQDANGKPIIPLETLRKHGFDKEPVTETLYPQVHGS